MKKFVAFCCAVLCSFSLFAQESEEEIEETQVQNIYSTTIAGDQYINIALDVVMPLNFPDFPSLFKKNDHQLSVGGMGSLGYHYFLTNMFAVGFDLGFGFNVTIGSHIFNYVPVTFAATFQPSWGKFEFPMTANIGFAWESYNNNNYFPGLVVKPEVGVHYRLAEGWALGGDISYTYMPQFMKLYDGEAENYHGQFLNIGVSARYYF